MANPQEATFGGGCFWCIESAMNKLKGVISATSGFSGGTRPNPTYEQVITGVSGHAEVVHIKFDADIIAYELLLEIFFQLHDPTTLNKQGNDVGPQYRSIILFHSPEQEKSAIKKIETLNQMELWPHNIVTEVKKFEAFYPADHYHQGYADKNPNQPYCALLITPKLEKFKAVYREWLK